MSPLRCERQDILERHLSTLFPKALEFGIAQDLSKVPGGLTKDLRPARCRLHTNALSKCLRGPQHGRRTHVISDQGQLPSDASETKRHFPLRSELVCETNPSLEFPQSGTVIALPLVELAGKDEVTQDLRLVGTFLLDHRKGLVHESPSADDVTFDPPQVRQLPKPSHEHEPIAHLTEKPDHLFHRRTRVDLLAHLRERHEHVHSHPSFSQPMCDSQRFVEEFSRLGLLLLADRKLTKRVQQINLRDAVPRGSGYGEALPEESAGIVGI